VGLLESTIREISVLDEAARRQARARLDQLVMPHWALGRLMDTAELLAAMTGTARPSVARKTVVVMAGDHGVTAEGVSKYPAEVTPQMVHGFVAGHAGINVLAGIAGARVVVVDMGVAGDLSAPVRAGKVISKRLGPGTANIARGPAMDRATAVRGLEAGIEIARDLADSTDLFGAGDMGIGNTTPSSAIVAVLCEAKPEDVTGRGTGIDKQAWERKVQVVRRALEVNKPDARDPVDVLAKVGGFEIAGLAGLMLGAAARRKPVLVDGFISTAGALVAQVLCPLSVAYLLAAHRSVEPGHRAALERLGKQPLLDLNLRLGEGTGAALAMPLVEASVRVLTEMATFEEAAVSGAKS